MMLLEMKCCLFLASQRNVREKRKKRRLIDSMATTELGRWWWNFEFHVSFS